MIYQRIRTTIMKNESLFAAVSFCFTPIRLIKEFFIRRNLANQIIKGYQGISKETKKIFYFGIPEHNNLGDIAQTYCTRKWLKNNFPDYMIIEGRTRVSFDRKLNRFMKDVLSENDYIFFQSGYCTRHKNPDHMMHLHIAKRFSFCNMVVLPQTVKLADEKDILKTREIFKGCPHLKFITRDSVSYEFAKTFIDEKRLLCYPDIVTSLIGRVNVLEKRSGILLCVRNDDEKYYSDQELNYLCRKLSLTNEKVDLTDTNSDKTAEEVYNDLESEVRNKIIQFAKYKCVITDRYHGTIFSLIANTPVIVIKTNDHKVTSALEWFDSCFEQQSVQLADSLDIAAEMAIGIIQSRIEINNDDILYKKYYWNNLQAEIGNM